MWLHLAPNDHRGHLKVRKSSPRALAVNHIQLKGSTRNTNTGSLPWSSHDTGIGRSPVLNLLTFLKKVNTGLGTEIFIVWSCFCWTNPLGGLIGSYSNKPGPSSQVGYLGRKVANGLGFGTWQLLRSLLTFFGFSSPVRIVPCWAHKRSLRIRDLFQFSLRPEKLTLIVGGQGDGLVWTG